MPDAFVKSNAPLQSDANGLNSIGTLDDFHEPNPGIFVGFYRLACYLRSEMTVDQKRFLGSAAFLLAIVLFSFRELLVPDRLLLTTDDVFGLLQYRHGSFPESWLVNWSPLNLIGFGSGQESFSVTNLMLCLLSPIPFVNWIRALDTFGAGLFLFLFLRQKRCSVVASLFGAITYCFASPMFSFVHAGHLGKFGTFLWFAATLWALECSFNKPKAWSWRILAGAFLGLTVAEQPDVALLFVWLFVAYLAFRVFSEEGRKIEQSLLRFVGLLALSGIVSGIIAANVVLAQYQTQVKGIVQVKEENTQEAWEWATQWSYPPEEVLEMIAPGFFGWRTDTAEGTYWGRVGRSAAYEQSKQGFPRFKLDTSFFGIVPLFLAVAMATFAFRRAYRDKLDPKARRDIVFWSITAIVVLLLAFGKYFLLYNFFYAIPKMNIIRNPNKFMHLFTVAIAVLSAYGFHRLVEQRAKELNTRRFWQILAGLGGAALLGAIYIYASNESIMARFQDEFGKASASIVSTMSNSLLRLAVSCGIFAVFWYWLNRLPAKSALLSKIPFLIILLATVDLYLTNRHYVEYYEYKPVYAENELARFLKSDPEPHRVKILPRDPRDRWFGLYNNWLTTYFPYHRIQSLDIPQMPRMPEDYKMYLETVGPHPLRFWQLTNCKYLLGSLEHWQQLKNDPLFEPHLELVHAYNLSPSTSAHAVLTSPAKPNQFNQTTQVILRYKNALPRAKFYEQWRIMSNDRQCLRTLIDSNFDPVQEVIVSEPVAPQTNAVQVAKPARVEWITDTDNVDVLRVSTEYRGVLLFNEKYDPAFVVTVDGQPAELLRCNFIMKGVLIEPGTHEVRFEYRPPRIGFYISVAGWIGCLIGIPLLRWYERQS